MRLILFVIDIAAISFILANKLLFSGMHLASEFQRKLEIKNNIAMAVAIAASAALAVSYIATNRFTKEKRGKEPNIKEWPEVPPV